MASEAAVGKQTHKLRPWADTSVRGPTHETLCERLPAPEPTALAGACLWRLPSSYRGPDDRLPVPAFKIKALTPRACSTRDSKRREMQMMVFFLCIYKPGVVHGFNVKSCLRFLKFIWNKQHRFQVVKSGAERNRHDALRHDAQHQSEGLTKKLINYSKKTTNKQPRIRSDHSTEWLYNNPYPLSFIKATLHLHIPKPMWRWSVEVKEPRRRSQRDYS